jgi:hypothetical protein
MHSCIYVRVYKYVYLSHNLAKMDANNSFMCKESNLKLNISQLLDAAGSNLIVAGILSFLRLIQFIHSFSSLSYDKSKASSKAFSPHSAIYNFLFQMRVSSPFLKVIE